MSKYFRLKGTYIINYDFVSDKETGLGLSTSERDLYNLILGFVSNGQACTCSEVTIAKRLNYTQRTIRTAKNNLVEKGLITTKVKEGIGIEYDIVTDMIKDFIDSEESAEEKISSDTGKNFPTTEEEISPNNKNNNKYINNKAEYWKVYLQTIYEHCRQCNVELNSANLDKCKSKFTKYISNSKDMKATSNKIWHYTINKINDLELNNKDTTYKKSFKLFDIVTEYIELN